MKRLESPVDVERFRALVLARLGLQFEDAKLGFLAEIVQTRLDEKRVNADEYLHALEFDTCDDELPALANKLTVPETYFFRNYDQFRALRHLAIPARLEQAPSRKLNILSAGCASGEEPYSIAMTLLGMGLDPSRFNVTALDINPMALKKARRAHYSSWAFREMPQDQQQRWFHPNGRDFVLSDVVRAAVSFHECNLAENSAEIWRPNAYDVIFCRNVLMYFAPDQARKAIDRITQSLAPGGFLFLGHAETLRGLSDNFHLHHTHNAFYYARKNPDEAADALPVAFFERASAPAPSNGNALDPGDDWIQSIHRASARVHALSVGTQRLSARRSYSPPTQAALDIKPVFAMLHSDRFDEALAYVRDLPTAAGDDPDVLLVEAMLLAHASRTADAENACHRLLRIDEMNASAHHVLALCRETAGDLDAAMEHDRIAAYLDPSFGMPHLHMGLLGRRIGDRDMARRELALALPLLKHEDSARLMLFSGGFNRQSMIELCASALKDCGGAP